MSKLVLKPGRRNGPCSGISHVLNTWNPARTAFKILVIRVHTRKNTRFGAFLANFSPVVDINDEWAAVFVRCSTNLGLRTQPLAGAPSCLSDSEPKSSLEPYPITSHRSRRR